MPASQSAGNAEVQAQIDKAVNQRMEVVQNILDRISAR